MRQGLAALAFVLLMSGCGGGGTSAVGPAVPQPSPTATSSLAAVDALLNGQVTQGLVPGLVLGVAHHGTITLRAYGNRSLAPTVAADTQTAFQVGSITKQFTAACILMLAHSGSLRLDEPLSDFIPEYAHAPEVTLRQMLTMSSGVPADVGAGFVTLYGPIDQASVLQRLSQAPLDFTPGSQFAYSNLGYYLLGIVIERVSHETYPQYLQDHILTPLSLTHTFYLANVPSGDVALGYWHNQLPVNPFEVRPSWSSDYLFSMGGIVSTVSDILTWHRALLGGQVLDAASLSTMFTVPALPAGASTNYAMGWFIDPGERWHNGETSGFHSATALYSNGDDIVLLGNTWDQYAGAYAPEQLVLTIHALLGP